MYFINLKGVQIITNNTGKLPANGHRIQGRSSEDFLDADDILKQLNIQGHENFMDAGCGDGHVAIKALKYIKDGNVFAVDIYEPSIEDLNKYKNNNNIKNLKPILSDISYHIDVNDNIVDIVLLVNVFHGFTATKKVDEAINELSRIINDDTGRIAIMDFKKQDVKHGPPVSIRSSPQQLEKIFKKHGFKVAYLNSDTGEDIPEGKSHYLIIFEKD